jgi:hypothetical protein
MRQRPDTSYACNGDVALARAPEVFANRTLKDPTAGVGSYVEDAGEHELKGVPDRWRLYRAVA